MSTPNFLLQLGHPCVYAFDFAITTEEKARGFFLEGVEHEQNGELFEAIQKYRKAVNLVPDIEFKVEQERRRDGDNGHLR